MNIPSFKQNAYCPLIESRIKKTGTDNDVYTEREGERKKRMNIFDLLPKCPKQCRVGQMLHLVFPHGWQGLDTQVIFCCLRGSNSKMLNQKRRSRDLNKYSDMGYGDARDGLTQGTISTAAAADF